MRPEWYDHMWIALAFISTCVSSDHLWSDLTSLIYMQINTYIISGFKDQICCCFYPGGQKQRTVPSLSEIKWKNLVCRQNQNSLAQMEITQRVSWMYYIHENPFCLLLWLLLLVLHFNLTQLAHELVHMNLHRRRQLSRRSFSMARDTFAFTPRPPPNVVWLIGPQCVLNASLVCSRLYL